MVPKAEIGFLSSERSIPRYIVILCTFYLINSKSSRIEPAPKCPIGLIEPAIVLKRIRYIKPKPNLNRTQIKIRLLVISIIMPFKKAIVLYLKSELTFHKCDQFK